jgi:hypothetical protein
MSTFVETGFAAPEVIRDSATAAARAMKLIQSRQIPHQLRGLTHDRTTQDWVLNRLAAIQIAVYSLDSYGETCWSIQSARLTQLWEAITKEILAVGIGVQQVEMLTDQMHRYQHLEMSLRTGSELLAISLARFYEIKTCDVRMSRAILSIVTRGDVHPEPAWDCFDTISEVCDDLEDVAEDANTFNCNRFLLERWATGYDTTVLLYLDFLEVLSDWIQRLALQYGSDHPILRMSARQLAKARSLVHRDAINKQRYWAASRLIPALPGIQEEKPLMFAGPR